MAIRLDHGTDELGEVHGMNVTPFRRHAGLADHLHGRGALATWEQPTANQPRPKRV